MSDDTTTQDRVTFACDATFEVVTSDEQKLAVASSGTVNLDRPDRLRTNRANGFVDFEMVFDGRTLSLLGRETGRHARVETPGTSDDLLDELRDTYGLPLPAADLLTSEP